MVRTGLTVSISKATGRFLDFLKIGGMDMLCCCPCYIGVHVMDELCPDGKQTFK